MALRQGGTLDIEDAKTCPFCGAWPEIEPWHGGGPNKHMVSCVNERCHAGPGVSGSTKRMAINLWNARAPSESPVR